MLLKRQKIMLGKNSVIWELRGLPSSEANSVRRSAYLSTLEQMEPGEREEIDEIQQELIVAFKGLGAIGSLEVIARIGQWLNDTQPLNHIDPHKEGRGFGGKV